VPLLILDPPAGAIATWLRRTNVWRRVTSPARGGKATKPQRTFDRKVKDCSDDGFAPPFGLESTVPIGTRPCTRASSNNRVENEITVIE
jgi:hypothetical protein